MKERVKKIFELLSDPFRADELREELEKLEEVLKETNRETLINFKEDFERIKALFERNRKIIEMFIGAGKDV